MTRQQRRALERAETKKFLKHFEREHARIALRAAWLPEKGPYSPAQKRVLKLFQAFVRRNGKADAALQAAQGGFPKGLRTRRMKRAQLSRRFEYGGDVTVLPKGKKFHATKGRRPETQYERMERLGIIKLGEAHA